MVVSFFVRVATPLTQRVYRHKTLQMYSFPIQTYAITSKCRNFNYKVLGVNKNNLIKSWATHIPFCMSMKIHVRKKMNNEMNYLNSESEQM